MSLVPYPRCLRAEGQGQEDSLHDQYPGRVAGRLGRSFWIDLQKQLRRPFAPPVHCCGYVAAPLIPKVVNVLSKSRLLDCVMLKLTEEIAECYRRAHESREQAERTPDPSLKQDFLDLERRWLSLARSYEFSERVRISPNA